MSRIVVAEMWTGSRVVWRLPEDREPTQAELDQIATNIVPWNDGIRPDVRVIETSSIPGGWGTAGSTPRRTVPRW